MQARALPTPFLGQEPQATVTPPAPGLGLHEARNPESAREVPAGLGVTAGAPVCLCLWLALHTCDDRAALTHGSQHLNAALTL